MSILEDFEIAAGSVPGSNHTMPGRPGWTNNHDAFAWKKSLNHVIGVVCDGCGGAKHSEIGAKLFCKILLESLHNILCAHMDYFVKKRENVISFLEHDLLAKMQHIISFLKPSYSSSERLLEPDVSQIQEASLALDYFLFTTLFFVVTPKITAVYSIGDGFYSVNGKSVALGPFKNNEPPYLTYRLMKKRENFFKEEFCFQQDICEATENIESLFIGTDGLGNFLLSEDQLIPRIGERVGPLSQFWTDDKYFSNRDAINRKLAMVNREYIDDKRIRGGPLQDDTTLVVLRRKRR